MQLITKISRLLIFIIIILYFSTAWLTVILKILPPWTNWIKFFLLSFLFLKIIFLKIDRIRIDKIDIFFFLLIFISLLSIYISNESYLKGLLGLKDLIIPIIIFYVIRYEQYNHYFNKYVLYVFLLIGLIQIIPVAYQFNAGLDFDDISGTFGRHQTGTMVLFIVSLISLCISLYINTKKRIFIFLILALSIIPILNSARIFYLLLFIPLVITLITKTPYKQKIKKVYALITLLLIAIVFNTAHYQIYNSNVFELFTKKLSENIRLQSDQNSTDEMRRISSLIFTYSMLKHEKKLLLGFGPGTLKGTIFGKETATIFGFSNPFSGSPSGYSFTLFEYGLPVVLIYLIMIYYILKQNFSFYKKVNNNFLKGFSTGLFSIIILFVIGELYTSLWTKNYALFFWAIAGIIFKENENFKIRMLNANRNIYK